MTVAQSAPLTQRAWVLSKLGGELKLVENHPVPSQDKLLPGQCLVKLTHTGVCHTDLAIRKGLIPVPVKPDLIGGHEAVGVVAAVGGSSTGGGVRVGERVGVKVLGDSCFNCEMCRKGLEQYCTSLKTTGVACDGTFAEYVVASMNHVTPIPDALDSVSATAIMCAGVTVYNALQQSNTHSGDWVVIPGAGGGLGHLAIQYAVVMGLRVVAIDTGDDKGDLSLSLGAEKWIDFKKSSDLVGEVRAVTGGGAHAAIVIADGAGAYEAALGYIRPQGTIIAIGVPPSNAVSLSLIPMCTFGLTIRGVFLGNRQQAIEAVNIAATGKVKCISIVRRLDELERVYEEMEQGKIAGRVVLEISK